MRGILTAMACALALTACSSPTSSPSGTVTVTATPNAQIQISTVTVTATPPAPPGPARQLNTEGIYVVGSDIVPGRWRTQGGERCYWARLGDLTGDEILDNSNSVGPQVVDILPSDVAFQLRGCASWYLDEG